MARRKSRKKSPLAIIDTCVLYLLIADPDDPKEGIRTRRAEATLAHLQSEKVQFVLPAPTMAEIDPKIAMVIMEEFGGAHVEPFDLPAAEATRLMILAALPVKPGGPPKSQVKFDAMIAGIAEKMGARYIVTANGRDFRKYLKATSSKVRVVDTDEDSPPIQEALPFPPEFGRKVDLDGPEAVAQAANDEEA